MPCDPKEYEVETGQIQMSECEELFYECLGYKTDEKSKERCRKTINK